MIMLFELFWEIEVRLKRNSLKIANIIGDIRGGHSNYLLEMFAEWPHLISV